MSAASGDAEMKKKRKVRVAYPPDRIAAAAKIIGCSYEYLDRIMHGLPVQRSKRRKFGK